MTQNPLDTRIKVVYVPTESLHPSPVNPRLWSEKATEDLEQSIRNFGLTEALLVNAYPKRKNRIVSGHFRWTIAKKLGLKTVPVVYVNIASEKKERELLLRMNANQGAWDFDLLKSFDIDLLLDVGFDTGDLGAIFDDNLDVEDDGFDEDKAVEEAQGTDIKPGDMFALGRHKLICGDATDPKVIERLMGKARADIIDIDMPYNIGLSYDKGVGGKAKYGGTTNDSKTDAEYRAFAKAIMVNAVAIAKPDCHSFFWCDERYVWLFQGLYKELGLDSKRVCIWLKDNASPTPNIAFNKVTEFIVYATRGRPFLSDKVRNLNEIVNKEVSTGNRLTDDVLDLFNVWIAKRLPSTEYSHPTQKNPTVHEKALRRCSKPGDIILDATCGSGSILSACEQLKRTAYLCDYEPVFCQVVINRFKKISNEKITKLN
jgi:DNA modification methylase